MNKLFFLGAFLLLASTQAFAKVGIPIGSREVLEKVHDLPDTDEYKNGSTYSGYRPSSQRVQCSLFPSSLDTRRA